MAIEWINKKSLPGSASFLENSITFNTTAMRTLGEYAYAMVGLDAKKKKVIIKPIDYATYERGEYDKNLFYKITIKRSYARITSKDIIQDIIEKVDSNIVGKKCLTSWSVSENVLYIELGRGE